MPTSFHELVFSPPPFATLGLRPECARHRHRGAAARARTLHKRAKVDDPNAPVIARAEEITGRPDREINLERDAELIKGKTRMTADTACYKAVEDEVTASGNVNMWRFGDRYKGDALQLNSSSGKGWVLHPEYRMELNNAQGKANRIDFISEDEAVVTDGTYSTCEGPNPDWYLKSSTLRLDTGRDVGTGRQDHRLFQGRADHRHPGDVVLAVGRAPLRLAAAVGRLRLEGLGRDDGAVLFQHRAEPRPDRVSRA